MKTSPERDPRLDQFPSALRQLLDAELAAGNTIEEVASCHPAPPAGAYAKLTKPITTRPREKTAEIDFYDRNTSIYSGEWTDAKRFYFILEPPHPPLPEPDMNAIREAMNRPTIKLPGTLRINPGRAPAKPRTRVEQFEASMIIDYEKWHDGIGYDLTLLEGATAEELAAIEKLVLARGAQDWRDVEALAVLKSAKAQAALRVALQKGNAEIRGAVLRHAPKLVPAAKKKAHLLSALRTAEFYGGLSEALDTVADYHPREIVAELFRGTLAREGGIATHFAAMLMFIHGKAKQPFDWDQRPFFLRFNTTVRAEREAAFRELCDKIGVSAAKYLGRK